MRSAFSRSKLTAAVAVASTALFLSQCVYLPIKRERRVQQMRVGMTLAEVEALLGPVQSGPRTVVPKEPSMDCPAGVEVESYRFTGYAHLLINNKWEDNVGVGMIDGRVCSFSRYGL